MLGADTGTVRFAMPNTQAETPVTQGAFGQKITTGRLTYFTKVEFDYVADDGTVTVFRRNTGPDFYVPVLKVKAASSGTYTHTFLAGAALVSFPVTPRETDVARLFGSSDANFPFAWWDPTKAGDDKYRRYPAIPTIKPGAGYWLKLPASQTVTVTGDPPPDNSPSLITLQPGWNAIGNMLNATLNPWAMTVETGTVAIPLADAISRDLVSPVWTYDGTTASYGVKRDLEAWEGAWIANMTGGTLNLRQQYAARSRSRGVTTDPLSLLTVGGWGVPIQAAAGRARDTMAWLGVSSRAQRGVDGLDWLKPPVTGDGVRVAFIQPLRPQDGANYATDIRDAVGARQETWDFDVSYGQSDRVTLTWPDLRGLPAQYEALLQDQNSGASLRMRTTPSYTFLATGTAAKPDARRFRVTIAPRSAQSALSISQLTLSPAREKLPGASVRFLLSALADVTMEVRTTAGRLLRTVVLPATRANEPVTLAWDGRGLGGTQAPAGAYLLVLTARAADGSVTRRSLVVNARR